MKEKKIKILEAKGRPMLHWVGKKPLDYIKSFPAQLVEVFDGKGNAEHIENLTFEKLKNNWQNLLFHGDNKEVLGFLLANGFRGKIDLIYIDPPFNTGINYVRQVQLRRFQGNKLQGEDESIKEQLMYHNNFYTDNFLQFLYERLQLLHELLSTEGAIFVRIDVHQVAYLNLIMHEIFGQDCFMNQIVVSRVRKNVTTQGRLNIPNAFDVLLVYSKNPNWGYVNILKETKDKTPGYWRPMDSAGVRPNPQRIIEGKTFLPPPGRHFTFSQERADEMYKAGRIRLHPTTGKPEYWVDEKEAITLDTNWLDISGYTFTTGYPTENSDKLLERVIKVGSKGGDLILDVFIGSGTTAAVAQYRGRRWIGCDINKGAIQTTSKRLQRIILEKIEEEREKSKQKKLLIEKEEIPKYYSFAHYKVNDYDLQLLRTEAIELAIQHIGIQRTKTDSFFEGLLGKNLVKIIDFNHPLSLLDLQLIQDELRKRPDENRNITVVCLGKELAVDPWIEDYNKKHPVNKIEIIELRTDSKYGKFLIHKPSEAKVEIKRKGDKAVVELKEFISPSIIERLNNGDKVIKIKIPDFRSMIDVVLIDNDYDGKVFNIKYSDVPEKKSDLVVGKYEIDIPKKKAVVAVKIIDMLGEEVLITKEI